MVERPKYNIRCNAITTEYAKTPEESHQALVTSRWDPMVVRTEARLFDKTISDRHPF
jgi:hypothetical protein